MQLHLTYKDGREVDVETSFVDTVNFERHFGVSAAGIFTEVSDGRGGVLWNYDKDGKKTTPRVSARAEYLAFFAYSYEQRENGETLEFDPWLATVEVVTLDLSDPKASTSRKTRKRSASPPSQ